MPWGNVFPVPFGESPSGFCGPIPSNNERVTDEWAVKTIAQVASPLSPTSETVMLSRTISLPETRK